MNERIKQLALEAKDWAYAEHVGFTAQMLFEQKFAELIVAKCVAQCEFVAGQTEITNTGEMARKTKATANNCAFWIKQHFGVEE